MRPKVCKIFNKLKENEELREISRTYLDNF